MKLCEYEELSALLRAEYEKRKAAPRSLGPEPMNWIEQCKHEAQCLSPELRQQVLDELRAGRTIGQARDKYGLTLAAVCGVVDTNIVCKEYLTLHSKSA